MNEPIYATPEQAEALAHQGFVKQHVVSRLTQFKPAEADIEIRKAEMKDVEAFIRLELQFEEHMRKAPINAVFESETEEEMRAGFEEQLFLPNFVTLVALEKGRVVGMAYACSTEYSKLHSGERRPPNSATFAKAVIDKEHRRQGIGLALATETIKAIRELGFDTIVSDWRLANVEANQAWSRLGFTPTWFRMINE